MWSDKSQFTVVAVREVFTMLDMAIIAIMYFSFFKCNKKDYEVSSYQIQVTAPSCENYVY